MKIIDLLNKIANGEEVPDAIKWGCHDFEWFVYEYKAKGELGEPTLLDYLSQCPQMLNDKIITFDRIEEKKIPEKLKIEQDTPTSNYYIRNENGTKCALTKHSKMIVETLNQVIDYLKSKGDE